MTKNNIENKQKTIANNRDSRNYNFIKKNTQSLFKNQSKMLDFILSAKLFRKAVKKTRFAIKCSKIFLKTINKFFSFCFESNDVKHKCQHLIVFISNLFYHKFKVEIYDIKTNVKAK